MQFSLNAILAVILIAAILLWIMVTPAVRQTLLGPFGALLGFFVCRIYFALRK